MTEGPDLFSASAGAAGAMAPRLTASCGLCGAANAPFGLRRPGHFSKLKPGKRFVLFHCGGEACAAEAAARLAAAAAGGSASQGEAREPARLGEAG